MSPTTRYLQPIRVKLSDTMNFVLAIMVRASNQAPLTCEHVLAESSLQNLDIAENDYENACSWSEANILRIRVGRQATFKVNDYVHFLDGVALNIHGLDEPNDIMESVSKKLEAPDNPPPLPLCRIEVPEVVGQCDGITMTTSTEGSYGQQKNSKALNL